MNLIFLFKGLLLGFSIAAPVGPIGILCIRRTLQYGRFSGLFSGLGAALADTLYGIIAACSVTLVSDFLNAQHVYIRLFGGIFLLFLGAKTFFVKTSNIAEPHISHRSIFSDLFSTFFLTLSNPLTLFSFIAVFAGLGLMNVSDQYIDAITLVAGIFLGASTWWLLLAEGVTLFRKKVSEKTMSWINRSAGMIIVTFGLAALLSILH